MTQRKGCATIRLEVEGKAAHAGLNYRGGADASLELARLVTMLAEHNDPEKGIFFNAGRLRSGSHGDIVSDRAEGDVFFSFPNQADFQEVERLLARVGTPVGSPPSASPQWTPWGPICRTSIPWRSGCVSVPSRSAPNCSQPFWQHCVIEER